MKLETLRDLYIEQLQDIYSAETQIIEALPKIIDAVSSEDLKDGLENHLKETQQQVQRLEQILKDLDANPKGQKCKGMKGLLDEGAELLAEDAEPEVLDAGIIASCQRVEHYEIAAYGTVRNYAQLLGHQEHAQLLTQTLNEEKQADETLSEAAEEINVEAKAA